MNQKIIILGASGHGRVIADICKKNGDTVVGFLDDTVIGVVIGIPILGKIEDIVKYKNKANFLIGIGNNNLRKQIADRYTQVQWAVEIHPSAQISEHVSIDDGTVIMAEAVVNIDAQIGKHCIVNTGAIIEHDCKLSNFVHISPNATLCGTVFIGEKSHIGASATVINNICIASNVIIGAGAVVIRNIDNSGTFVGCPAYSII